MLQTLKSLFSISLVSCCDLSQKHITSEWPDYRRDLWLRPLHDVRDGFCPNRKCSHYLQRGLGNLRPYGYYGKSRTRRILCNTCLRTFSEKHPHLFFGFRVNQNQAIAILLGSAAGYTVGDIAADSDVNKNTVLRVLNWARRNARSVYMRMHSLTHEYYSAYLGKTFASGFADWSFNIHYGAWQFARAERIYAQSSVPGRKFLQQFRAWYESTAMYSSAEFLMPLEPLKFHEWWTRYEKHLKQCPHPQRLRTMRACRTCGLALWFDVFREIRTGREKAFPFYALWQRSLDTMFLEMVAENADPRSLSKRLGVEESRILQTLEIVKRHPQRILRFVRRKAWWVEPDEFGKIKKGILDLTSGGAPTST